MSNILSLNKIKKSFGGLTAISDVSFSIKENSIVGLLGPNGAGKTTLFNLITGNLTPNTGIIEFADQVITNMSPHKIVELGIARTFQNIRLFGELSVLENVLCGAHCRLQSGFFSSLLQGKRQKEEEETALQTVMEELFFVGLESIYSIPAKNLSYGQQRLLEIARALASKPRFIILDEPAGGMNEQETSALIDIIQSIQARGITVLLIEHDMRLVMKACEELLVLDYGTIIAQGKPKEIRNNPEVIRAYLGTCLDE